MGKGFLVSYGIDMRFVIGFCWIDEKKNVIFNFQDVCKDFR